jgi:hypothetical protein
MPASARRRRVARRCERGNFYTRRFSANRALPALTALAELTPFKHLPGGIGLAVGLGSFVDPLRVSGTRALRCSNREGVVPKVREDE